MNLLLFLVGLGFIGGEILSITPCCNVRISFLDVSVGVIVFCWWLKRFKIDRLRKYGSLFGPFLAISTVSILFQSFNLTLPQILISALYLVRFTVYSMLFVVAATFDKKEKFLKLLWILGVMIAILGILQYFLYPNLRNLAYLGWDPHQYRIFSTLLDPNFTGIVLVLTLILSAYLLQLKNTLLRKFVIIASGLVFISLLLTYSRGAYLALVTVFGVWMIYRRKILNFVIILLGLGVLVSFLPKPGGEGINLFRTLSIQSRLENNQEALALFWKSPLIGHGFNSLRFVRTTQISASHSGAGFHNSFLYILTTTGIVGLTLYLWMWVRLFNFKSKDKKIKTTFFLSLIAVGVHSWFDNSLFYPWVMVWLWLLAGIIYKDLSGDPSSSASGRTKSG